MSLTLEEVRNTKFHVARRQGYDTTEVDLFVDKVEAAFGQIVEENEMMRSQLEAMKESQPEQDEQYTAAPQAAEGEIRKQVEAEYEKKIAELKEAHAADLKAARDEAAKAKQDAQKAREDASRAGQQAPAAAAPAAAVGTNAPVTDAKGRVVVTTAAEAGAWVQRAVEDANKIAEEADAEANTTIENAKQQAQQITDEAKGRAARVEQDARANAERITSQAQNRAGDLDRELAEKRREAMSKLEGDRDQLNATVSRLRAFEGRYRQNLTKHLQDQIRSLESGGLEPEGADENPSTPRLDALAEGTNPNA